jgi:hypothetical protein
MGSSLSWVVCIKVSNKKDLALGLVDSLCNVLLCLDYGFLSMWVVYVDYSDLHVVEAQL